MKFIESIFIIVFYSISIYCNILFYDTIPFLSCIGIVFSVVCLIDLFVVTPISKKIDLIKDRIENLGK